MRHLDTKRTQDRRPRSKPTEQPMQDQSSSFAPSTCRDLLNTLEKLGIDLYGWPMIHDEVEDVIVEVFVAV